MLSRPSFTGMSSMKGMFGACTTRVLSLFSVAGKPIAIASKDNPSENFVFAAVGFLREKLVQMVGGCPRMMIL